MKTTDIRKKTSTEQVKLVSELEAELRAFRFGNTGGHSKNVRKSRAIRKDIARIKTIMHETK
jgi:ribosomal protein L29